MLIGCLFSSPVLSQKQTYKKVLLLMGSRFEFRAMSNDSTVAYNAIDKGIAEVRRIEAMISSWDPKSQTSEVNRNAGVKPVKVDDELFQLVLRSKKISKLTDGAFDISYASMDRLWKFDGSVQLMPPESEISQSVAKINFENIILDPEAQTIFLKKKGMKIGFGAIGKGYSANKAKWVMKNAGIEAGVVNAGGDLIAWGHQEDGRDWRVGITDPKDISRIISWLGISDMAVVTSGNYEKFIIIDGERYSHIIDPRTGYPSKGLKSVTIVCADAELADALATSVFVLGKENGLFLINQLNGIEGMFITDDDELIASEHLKINYYQQENKVFDYQVGQQ